MPRCRWARFDDRSQHCGIPRNGQKQGTGVPRLTEEDNAVARFENVALHRDPSGRHQYHLDHQATDAVGNKNERSPLCALGNPQRQELLQQSMRQPAQRDGLLGDELLRMLVEQDACPVSLAADALADPGGRRFGVRLGFGVAHGRRPEIAAQQPVAGPAAHRIGAGARHGDDVDARLVVREATGRVHDEA